MTTRAPIRVERDGALTVITLDRPDVLNAFDETLTSALTAAITDTGSDGSVRAVVITGAGRGFSAGQDLRDRAMQIDAGAELHLGDELRRRYHPLIAAIREMRKPVVAAVNGVVAGAGLGIAVACDVRVASSSASFRAAWTRVGLVPDAGSAYFLPRIVGFGRATDMILTGDPVSADEALRIGLVAQVYPAVSWLQDAKTLARTIAEKAPIAARLATEAVDLAWNSTLDAGLEFERKAFYLLFATEDKKEGVDAFVNKRKANFKGK